VDIVEVRAAWGRGNVALALAGKVGALWSEGGGSGAAS